MYIYVRTLQYVYSSYIGDEAKGTEHLKLH